MNSKIIVQLGAATLPTKGRWRMAARQDGDLGAELSFLLGVSWSKSFFTATYARVDQERPPETAVPDAVLVLGTRYENSMSEKSISHSSLTSTWGLALRNLPLENMAPLPLPSQDGILPGSSLEATAVEGVESVSI